MTSTAPSAASASSASSPSVVASRPIEKKKPVFVKIDSLTPDSKGDNLIVQVIKINQTLQRKKLDGTEVKLAEVLVGDSTGTILLTARNEQIDQLKPGEWFYVRNSHIQMHASHMRLAVDRWGLIGAVDAKDTPKENVNTDAEKNMSQTEWEKVNVPA